MALARTRPREPERRGDEMQRPRRIPRRPTRLGRTKGMHRVVWDLRRGAAEGSRGRSRGPVVAPGKYLLKLTTGTGTHEGNLVHGPANHSLVVLYGCSSLKNLGGACLAWWAATTWLGVRGGRSAIVTMFAVGVAVLGLNVVRLYLMAFDLGWYDFWHNGNGVAIYDLASSAVPIIAVILTVRHASRA